MYDTEERLSSAKNKALHDEAYERYRLDFMASHGHTLSQLANSLINYYENTIRISQGPEALRTGADILSIWAETTGFRDGDTWLGKAAFLHGPYQDAEYMKRLFSDSEDLLHWYHMERFSDTNREEEPYTMRLYMKPKDYALLNESIESFVIRGEAEQSEKFYGYLRTGDYAVGISSNVSKAIGSEKELPYLPLYLDIYQIRPNLTQGEKYSIREEIGQIIMRARASFPTTHVLMDRILEAIKNNTSIIGQPSTEKNFLEVFCSKDINKYDRYHFVMDGVFPIEIDALPMIAQKRTFPNRTRAKAAHL